jgi:hypothetical protein
MSTSLLSSLWNLYNAEDSYLPFLLPLSLWLTCWIHCKRIKRDYGRWYNLHTVHHVGAIVQASLSLYFNDNSIFHERITVLWSMPYFIVDIVDSIWCGHITYSLHALICLTLGCYNYTHPILQVARANSRAAFIESSTPIFYQVKQHRNPKLFGLFAMVFTGCRIVWVPLIGRHLLKSGMMWYDVPLLLLTAFYALNWFWYIKIVTILYNGIMGKATPFEETTTKEGGGGGGVTESDKNGKTKKQE